jgi:hypothetical protein
MIDKKLKLIEEISWDDDFDETSQEDVAIDKAKINAHEKAVKALDSMKFIENLDKKFDQVYKEILNKDNDLELFSAKVQRFELKNISQILKEKERKQSEISEEEKIKKDIQRLFNTESSDILKLFQSQTIQNNRKELYEMYDEIADINFIAYRMLRVYIDNILVKHMNTKQFININKNDLNQQLVKYDEATLHQVKKFIEMIILYFDIPKKFKNEILPKTLKYGDYYIEVANLEPIRSVIQGKPELITESIKLENNGNIKKVKLNLALIEFPVRKPKQIEELNIENLTPEQKLKKLKQKIFNKRQNLEEGEQSWIEEDDITLDDILNLDYDVIDNIYLRFLDPSQVLKVVKDGVLYGYIVVEDIEEDNDNYDEVNIYKRFLADNEDDENNKKNTENVADTLTKAILQKIAEYFGEDFSLDTMPGELQLSLKIMIYHKLLQKSKLKFRFIDPDRIANFHTVIDKYSPYGTSIFDPIVQPVKMYTIGLMTSIISRLSRAAVIRKWNIEVGNKRNYKQIIEQVKQDLKNKAVNYDNLTNIKNVTQILTDFRDIATITRDGQRFIDLEIMPTHDRALPIQELQDLRNELIMATGVPAVYLNATDVIDLRETLVNININFANTIITLQSLFEDGLNSLIDSIYKIIFELNGYDTTENNFSISRFFKISFNPPLVLQLQSTEALVASVANIIGVLNQAQVQIDPLILLKKYIPSINWDELKKSGEEVVKEEVKKQIIQQINGGQQQRGF